MKDEQLQIKQQAAERRKLHEKDARENQKRIQTLKQIRAYKILEKQALKEQNISDYNANQSRYYSQI